MTENNLYVDLQSEIADQRKIIVENLEEAYITVSNNPPNDTAIISDDDNTLNKKFIQAVQHLILQDYDPLIFDDSKSLVELISRLRNDICETEKLCMYKLARIEKIKEEIKSVEDNTVALQHAMKEFEEKKKVPVEVSRNQQLHKMKIAFNNCKNDMNHVIDTLYPSKKNEMSSFMADICNNHLNGDGSEYTKVDKDAVDINIIELLTSSKIISQHPQHKRMFKLNI